MTRVNTIKTTRVNTIKTTTYTTESERLNNVSGQLKNASELLNKVSGRFPRNDRVNSAMAVSLPIPHMPKNTTKTQTNTLKTNLTLNTNRFLCKNQLKNTMYYAKNGIEILYVKV